MNIQQPPKGDKCFNTLEKERKNLRIIPCFRLKFKKGISDFLGSFDISYLWSERTSRCFTFQN